MKGESVVEHLPVNSGTRTRARHLLTVSAFLLIVWVCWNCKDDISGQGTADIIFPDQPLFDRGCAFSGCHAADTFDERGYSLDTYQHALSRVGIIVPCFRNEACNPENSMLIRRVEGLDGLPKMPLYRPALTANQINGLKQWIREGAQNN
ncbi:MAG: hypothetical protein E6K56_00400 [Ignavibacteria bacterium]|nr:MAG: hypothetical protein E6K56_00400 [Ignavibacteria bacterium]